MGNQTTNTVRPHGQSDYPMKGNDDVIFNSFLLFQIDRQLSAYMRRVEDVLGKGWENHVEGQKLKGDGDSFRQKLNTQELFDDWSRKVGITQCYISSFILK